MPEELKEKIFNFLKEFPNQEFSVSKLKRELLEKGLKISYGTLLKWVMVLQQDQERDVIVKDFGNIKLVSYTGK